MFSPSTNLRLLSTPLTADYDNTLWFPDVATQTAYFIGKTVKAIDNFNYIKKDNTIVVSGDVDSYYNCNYIMYQNKNFTTKWFYAFIVRTEWAGMNQTRFYLATDVLQTWLFNITWFQSYVDRCHSDTDIAGDNIVPEDFSGGGRGGYHQVGTQDLRPNKLKVFSTVNSDGSAKDPTTINGIVSGSGVLTEIDIDTGMATLNTWLTTMVRQGLATGVSRIQQYPANHANTISWAKHPSSFVASNTTYTPKNKKLLSGAFLTAYITMYGQELEFNPEYITGANISAMIAVDETTGTVGVIITNYCSAQMPNLCITATIPESTWAYNQYKNDYNLHSASNAIYIERSKQNRYINKQTAILDTVSEFADTVSDLTKGIKLSGLISNPVGTVAGAVGSVTAGTSSTIKAGNNAYINAKGLDEITQDLTAISESYNAPAVGGVAQSNIFLASGKTALSFGYKVPPLDIVKRMDDFLTVYGYKQSTYRNINLHARSSWTYIKTNGLNIDGEFPQEDINTIKQVFDKGVFWWVYTAKFGNFDQANGIV